MLDDAEFGWLIRLPIFQVSDHAQTMIAVVDIPDSDLLDDPLELGLMLPVPANVKNAIILEDRDGEDVRRLSASAVQQTIGDGTVLHGQRIKIDLLITNARVALACSRYGKRGGWYGSPRATLNSRGKMLVGQARYPWIHRVGSKAKAGWSSRETLILDLKGERGVAMRASLSLPNNIDSALVAAEIARRAARYRLAREQLSMNAHQQLKRLAGSSHLSADQDGDLHYFEFPDPHPMTQDSARRLRPLPLEPPAHAGIPRERAVENGRRAEEAGHESTLAVNPPISRGPAGNGRMGQSTASLTSAGDAFRPVIAPAETPSPSVPIGVPGPASRPAEPTGVTRVRRRCPTCGAQNRVPEHPGHVFSCGKCKQPFRT